MRAWVAVSFLVAACGTPPSDDAPADSEPVDSEPADTDVVPATWRSALYPTDWTPGLTDAEGRYLPDVSWAGYRAGEAPLPTTLPEPRRSVVDEGADPTGATDATAAFQAAIDALVDGGTVWVPAGRYRVDGALTVRRSGVVVAGEGADASFVHFAGRSVSGGFGLRFAGAEPSAGEWPLAVDGGERAITVTVADADGLEVGDLVSVGWTITPDFVAAHGMTGTWVEFVDQWKPFFRRTVVAIEGDDVTLDVPLRYPALVRDGAALRPDDGHLTEVGIADLGVSTAVAEVDALAIDRHHALEFDRVMDGWIRGVSSFAPVDEGPELQSGGIYVQRSRRVTVADTTMGAAQHLGGGGNGYLFEVSRSGEVLVRDSVGHHGRHAFIQNWDFGTTGCVFLRITSREGTADNGAIALVGSSEFHHSLAMANLVDDSVLDDGWQAKNRHHESSGAGHTTTGSVFWNLRGTGELRSMQYGWGYVVGSAPELRVVTDPADLDFTGGGVGTAPADWAEGIGEGARLEPRSLYEDQLARRLGR